jgi:hypothetical protein
MIKTDKSEQPTTKQGTSTNNATIRVSGHRRRLRLRANDSKGLEWEEYRAGQVEM